MSSIKSIKERLLQGGMWVVGIRALKLVTGLAVNALLARLLSPNEMGVYFLIFSLVNFLMLFSLLGMDRHIVRLVAESLALGRTERAREAISYVLQLGVLSSVLMGTMIVSGVGHILTERVFRSPLMGELIYFPAIWLILFTIQKLVIESFRGLHNIRLASIFDGLFTSLIAAVTLGGLFWRYAKVDASVVLSVMIVACGTNLLIAFFFLKKETVMLARDGTAKISRSDIVKASYPLCLAFIVLSGMQQSHLWLLGHYSSKESVANFGSVLRLMVLVTATLDVVRLVVPPMVGDLYTKRNFSKVQEVLRTTATLAGIPSILALLMLICFGEKVLYYLYGPHYASGYPALIILAVGHLLNVLTGTPGVLLVMASKEKFLLWSALASGSIGFGVSIFLVETMDYIGVAIGASTGIIMQNFLMAWYCWKSTSIKTFMGLREVSIVTKEVLAILSSVKKRVILRSGS